MTSAITFRPVLKGVDAMEDDILVEGNFIGRVYHFRDCSKFVSLLAAVAPFEIEFSGGPDSATRRPTIRERVSTDLQRAAIRGHGPMLPDDGGYWTRHSSAQ